MFFNGGIVELVVIVPISRGNMFAQVLICIFVPQ